jgi:hypothetical protein
MEQLGGLFPFFTFLKSTLPTNFFVVVCPHNRVDFVLKVDNLLIRGDDYHRLPHCGL